jgi:hypothetical protein
MIAPLSDKLYPIFISFGEETMTRKNGKPYKDAVFIAPLVVLLVILLMVLVSRFLFLFLVAAYPPPHYYYHCKKSKCYPQHPCNVRSSWCLF